MHSSDLSDADDDLVAAAEALLSERFEPNRHTCAAAVRAASGDIYTAINFRTELGVVDVHAEQVAIGEAVTAGETDVEVSVAVMYADDAAERPTVVSACGVCRELIRTLSPDATVIVHRDDTLQKVPIQELLPAKS